MNVGRAGEHGLSRPLMLIACCALAGLPLTGCTERNPRFARDQQKAQSDQTAPQYDPAKAFLRLADIKPQVTRPTSAGRPAPLEMRAAQSLDRARSLRGERRYTEAALELERALRYQPDSVVLHREMAVTQWRAGNSARAQEQAQAAIDIDPSDAVSHYVLARLAASRFEKDTAIREYRLALLSAYDSGSRDYRNLARFHLAEYLQAEGYLSASIELYKQFNEEVAAAPADELSSELADLLSNLHGSANEQIALTYERLGKYKQAADYFRRAYAGRDFDDEARHHYARLLFQAGDLETAAVQLRQLLKTDRSAVDLLTRVYKRMGRPEGVLDDLRQLAADSPQDTELALAYADALGRFGRGEQAASFLRQKVDALPDNDDLRWHLFDVLVRQQRWNEALDVAAAALRRAPDQAQTAHEKVRKLAAEPGAADALATRPPEALPADQFASAYLHGVVASQAGQASAAAWFSAVIKARPAYIPARVALADIYLHDYRWKDAIAAVAPEGVALEPDTRIETAIGKAYAGLDEFDKAITHFQKAIALNRANTDAMQRLAEAYEASGEANRALRQYETLLEADPLNELARERLFFIHFADGDRQAAAAQISALQQMSASPNRIARCLATLELDPSAPDFTKFRDELVDAVKKNGPDAETLHLIAAADLKQNETKQAIDLLKQAISLDPRHEASAELLVLAYRTDLRFDEALQQLRSLLEHHPNRSSWRLSLIDLLLIVQRFDEAIDEAKDLLAEPGLDARVADILREQILETYRVQKEYTAAIDLLEEWRDAQPKEPDILRQLAEIEHDAGHDEKAFELAKLWQSRLPNGLRTEHDERIWKNLTPDQHTEMIQVILGQLENDPDNNELQVKLIELLRAIGRYDEAIALAVNNAPTGFQSTQFEIQVYLTYDAAGRTNDAISLLNRLMLEEGVPGMPSSVSDPLLRGALVQQLVKARRFQMAREKLNRWITEANSLEERQSYLQALSLVHQEAGDTIDARQALQLAYEISPTDVGLNNDLGYTYADSGTNLDKADEMTRYAVSNDPRNGAFLDSYGWVKYKEGQFEEARKWLHRARFTALGEDPVILDHLGDACWRAGDADAARQWWSQAVKLAGQRTDAERRAADRQILENTQAKLTALQQGTEPPVAAVVEANPRPQ